MSSGMPTLWKYFVKMENVLYGVSCCVKRLMTGGKRRIGSVSAKADDRLQVVCEIRDIVDANAYRRSRDGCMEPMSVCY